MSLLKLSGARIHSVGGKPEAGAEDEYWKGKVVFKCRLDHNSAEALKVLGSFNDKLDFTIPRERFLEEFCGENSCANIKFRLTGGDMATSVGPVSIHAAPVAYKDGDHNVTLTVTCDESQYRVLSEFGVTYKRSDGYLEIAAIQQALPFDQPKKVITVTAEVVDGEAEAVEKPKGRRKKKSDTLAAGAALASMKDSAEGAAARPN